MDKAVDLLKNWVLAQNVKGLSLEILREPSRTPIIFIEVEASEPGEAADVGSVLMYGHLDKQPPFLGWAEGLSPYKPVIRNGRLYGRGGADDGYSTFCAITSIKGLQKFNLNHGRIVIIIEACEESGSPDLPFYVEKYLSKIGNPNFIVCLDSGCGNYEQLWLTSSLRGLIGGHLSCKIVTEGVHSGDASGVVPDSFRLVRTLLSRLEDETSGEVLLKELKTELSEQRLKNVQEAAKLLGVKGIGGRFPLVSGAETTTKDPVQMALNRWWRPQLTITGCSGMPDCTLAGNVLRPETKVTLSMRLPPTVDAKVAFDCMKKELLRDPPYNCIVKLEGDKAASGWAAPELKPWLEGSLQKTSSLVFNKPAIFQGEGGSIPFMAMLGKMFPQAQFCVTGVLGPESNAHGPNEFLHIDFSAKLTVCIALILKDHSLSKVESLNKRDELKIDSSGLAKEFVRKADGTKI